jgi:uncharacterized protein YdeI (BOF family)
MQIVSYIGQSVLLLATLALTLDVPAVSNAQPIDQRADTAPTSQPADATMVTLSGTVIGLGEDDENEWQLRTDQGTVTVDAGPRWYQTIELSLGESVAVIGDWDGGELDAFQITRANGSVIVVRPASGPPPWSEPEAQATQRPQVPAPTVTPTPQPPATAPSGPANSTRLMGVVISHGEEDENEWQLRTDQGNITVDAGPRWYQRIDLSLGETVTIDGEFDDGEFDAFQIIRADGSVILVRSPAGPPPWADADDR